MKLLLILLLLFTDIYFGFAQIRGQVIDEDSKQGIGYALVMTSDHTQGIYTDEQGYFEIDAPMNDTLWATHIAYQAQSMIVSDTLNLFFVLKKNNITLREVVIREKRKKKKKYQSSFEDHTGFANKKGFWIKPTAKDSTLDGIDFFVTKRGNPTAPFRVGILKNIDDPESIYKDYVFEGQLEKGNQWVQIDFDKGLKIQDSVLVYIDILKTEHPKPEKDEPSLQGISLGIATYKEKRMEWENFDNTGWIKLEHSFNSYEQLMIEPVFD